MDKCQNKVFRKKTKKNIPSKTNQKMSFVYLARNVQKIDGRNNKVSRKKLKAAYDYLFRTVKKYEKPSLKNKNKSEKPMCQKKGLFIYCRRL